MIHGLKSRMQFRRDKHCFGNLSISKSSLNTHFLTWLVTTSNVIGTLLLFVKLQWWILLPKQNKVIWDKTQTCNLHQVLQFFPHECLFCRKVWKSQGKFRAREKLGKCESFQASDAILVAARKLNDSLMLCRISGIDMIAKEAQYHHSCRRTYLQRASWSTDEKECNPKMFSHSQAFE